MDDGWRTVHLICTFPRCMVFSVGLTYGVPGIILDAMPGTVCKECVLWELRARHFDVH